MIMLRTIATILLISSISAMAAEYDPLLLRTQATIFPKIILLDKDLENKIASNEIIISIVYSSEDKSNAELLKNLMLEQYAENLGNKKLTINLHNSEIPDTSNPSTAYFIMQGNPDAHEKITSFAARHKRVCFSYNYKDFKNNALISILIKEKTYIYLNKEAIQDYDIKFLPMFYNIVKVLE